MDYHIVITLQAIALIALGFTLIYQAITQKTLFMKATGYQDLYTTLRGRVQSVPAVSLGGVDYWLQADRRVLVPHKNLKTSEPLDSLSRSALVTIINQLETRRLRMDPEFKFEEGKDKDGDK